MPAGSVSGSTSHSDLEAVHRGDQDPGYGRAVQFGVDSAFALEGPVVLR